MAVVTRHVLVTGRVQKVGFRNYALTSALVAGLVGWVRNLRDGRVEALVQGEEEAIGTFVQQLKKGPPLSQVLDIQVKAVNKKLALTQFTVEKDGEEPWHE